MTSPSDLLEHAPCGLITASPTGRILAINATLLAWLGHREEELVGKRRFQELLTVPGKIFHDTHFAPLLRMQGFVHEVAMDLVRKDRGTAAVFVSANEKRTDDGAVELIRIVVFRARDRRKYESELLLARRMAEQAMRAKSDFMAVFAHEVRNSLSAVHFAAQLLERAGVPEPARPHLDLLQEALARVLGLVRSMLDFSKIEAGKAELEQRSFQLRELIRGVISEFQPAAREKNIELVSNVDPHVPEYVMGDAVKLGQVLTNLTGNAVKFTDAGSVTVTVRCSERSRDNVVLDFSVSDTGTGIARERIERVFEEYAQAGPEIGPRYGGTGLGLAISQRIVALHGSKLTVQSELGAGSTFAFQVALVTGQAEPE